MRSQQQSARAGVTLVEMLVVMTLIGLMVSIAYPTVTGGLSGIRLRGAIGNAQAFFLQAKQYADRQQQVVQLTVDPEANHLRVLSATGDWVETLDFKDGVAVSGLKDSHSVILFPGSPAPAFELLLAVGEDEQLGIRVNVLTGLPEDWDGTK